MRVASSSVSRAISAPGAADAGAASANGRDDRGREKAQPRGPNDQSLLPMKLTGVTRTIAIAWATISLAPDLDEEMEHDEVRHERERRDDEEAHALVRDVASLRAERPQTVPRVVVRHRDEERADRGRDVVHVEPEHEERVDRRG